jgi:hypothetical protein
VKERKQALGSMVEIERPHCWDNEFDIVVTQDNRCYVYRDSGERDVTGTFQYLMKQAGRNLFEEDRQWKMMQ